MITIDQLLESVDLDFVPRFVTKDEDGCISIWDEHKPALYDCVWNAPDYRRSYYLGSLKLSEFSGKDWTECIYEVPRKTDEYEQNLEKLRPADSDLVYRVKLPRKTTGKIEKLETTERQRFVMLNKINELVDAVNELKGANQ